MNLRLLNIKQALEIYLEHQIEVLTRKTEFNLKKATEREHILEGLHIATGNIDKVIKIIRESNDNAEAMNQLISEFGLSEIQAKAILEMKLRSLSGMERKKIEQELEQLKATILDLQDVLAKHERKIEIIDKNLDELVKKFGDERRTTISYDASSEIDDEDLIPVEDIIITMSKRGYFKRVPIDTYRAQKRGGVGVIGLQTHNDDNVQKIVAASTHTDILFFTDFGKVYRLRGYQIPRGVRTSKGIPAINLIGIEKNEKVLTILPIDNYDHGCLFFATVNGIVKRTSLSEFSRIQSNGKIAITLKEGDKLFNVIHVDGQEEIFLAGSNGNLARFNSEQVRTMGRTAAGVHGMRLDPKESIVGLSSSVSGDKILSIGSKGVGKLTPVEEYRLTKRNAKGVKTLKVNQKTGKLVYTGAVFGDEDVLMITTSGKIIRFSLTQVNTIGRSTSGVKLMNIDESEKIQSVTIFKSNEQSDEQEIEINNENLDDNNDPQGTPNVEEEI